MNSLEVDKKDLKVMGLDLSGKTGWSLFDGSGKLLNSGSLKKTTPKDIKTPYPWNFKMAADAVADEIIELIKKHKPNVIVVEESNSSKARYSQKILEFIHKSFLDKIVDFSFVRVYYINTISWRSSLGLAATKEDKKNNRLVNKAKAEGKTKKEVGLKGKITHKHRSVRFVNATFGLSLKMKDNDAADAICIAMAFIKGVDICEGK